jgi:ferredoxin
MRISSVPGACEAHGQCAMADDTLFPLDDEGYTLIPAGGVEVAASKEPDARRGVNACPLQALRLTSA